jgi:FkbM family methyltransferase
VIFDIGANVGYASVYFATRFPRARIIAVEPEASNFALLERNTAAFPNVTPVHAALWPHAARLAIGNPNDDSWAFQVNESAGSAGDSVRGVSMDQLLEEHDVSRIDILKIDIEGAEKEVFEPGCESWLAKTRVLVVELHDWFREGCGTAFYAATSRFPFKHFSSGENVVLVRSGEDPD